MSIQVEQNTPGLWVDPRWQAGDSGTFAVVIGVSHYDFLDGTDRTYRLGQLHVSALTAYRFFLWLRDRYKYGTSPLVRCWLLLSHSPEEANVEPALAQHQLVPTLANCRRAIVDWFKAMKDLPAGTAEESRSFFFFSGHGLEVYTDQQILLPSDYLDPATGANVNLALSTQNLAKGIKPLKVMHHFFLLDACRNDHDNLGQMDELTGEQVLNVLRSRYHNKPPCYSPVFYASASGTQAWEPNHPRFGLSIFGQALLDGLKAETGLSPDCTSGTCKVKIHLLEDYLKRRVPELLKGQNVAQYVMLGGNPLDSNAVLTEVPFPLVSMGVGPALPEPLNQGEMLVRTLDIHTDLADWPPRDAHAVFGSELMTEVWLQSARLYNLTERQPLANNEGYVIHRVSRDRNARNYRVEFSLTGERGNHLLQFADLSRTFTVLLPDDLPSGMPDNRPRYLLELETDGVPQHISRVDASLADMPNHFWLNIASDLWREYYRGTLLKAVNHSQMRVLEETLRQKIESPLAAVVAGLILLRAERWEELHDWLGNLSRGFPYLPDGPVLWTEQQLQRADENASMPMAALDTLLEIEKRGLPFTNETFGYAVRQADAFLTLDELDDPRRSRIQALAERLRKARRSFRSGGLFCVFAGKPGDITPGLVLGR
jgi:hypothetical protein